MSYKPFAEDVLFLGRVAIRRGAQNGYVLTSDANGNATWQAAGSGGATWGGITGTLSAQTDLQSALDAKQNESIVINSNTTADLDGVYTVVASATFTDPTPAEGKGFMVFVRNGTATVGGTGYSVAGTIINRVYHSGAWANYTSGLTALIIGTTPITSGTVGRVLFEGTGNVVQESANLYYDVTNGRLSLNQGASPGARLDIRAAGSSSTDLALRIRDSANALNLAEFQGNGNVLFRETTNVSLCQISLGTGTNGFSIGNAGLGSGAGMRVISSTRLQLYTNSLAGIELQASTTFSASPPVWIHINGGSTTTRKYFLGWGSNLHFLFENSNFGIGLGTTNAIEFGTSATFTFAQKTGVAPTTGLTSGDGYQQYSADIVAGNAAPHFRTENNDIVKIYSIGGWGTPTGTLTRTTFDTTTVTLAQLAERVAALISDLKTGQQLLKA
jgi:hypothetical protein